MDKTIDYYNNNAQSFYDRTINASIIHTQNEFLKLIPQGGYILDAGCGSGRDCLHFIESGYKTMGFDASIEMVKLSSELTGQKTRHATFQDIKLEDEVFDGIWACASLLHVDKSEIAQVVGKLYKSLKKDCVFYIALKYGDKDYTKDGRNFYIYNEDTIKQIFSDIKDYEVIDMSITQDGRADLRHQQWINCIIRKK